jgi:IPT/TIG domain
MRAESLAGQVVAVLSRRTPALQPAPGEPVTFPGRIHRISLLIQRSRARTVQAADAGIQQPTDEYGSDIATVPSEWPTPSDFNRIRHRRRRRHFITDIFVLAATVIGMATIPTALLTSQRYIKSAEPAPHNLTSAVIVTSPAVSSQVSPVGSAPGWIPNPGRPQSRRPSPVRNGGTSTACPAQGLVGEPTSPPCAPVALTASRLPATTSPPAPQASVSSPTPSSCADPTVTGVSPGQGSEGGGNTVTISGTGFGAGANVFFGSAPAQAATIRSSTEITATSPPGQPRRPFVNVTVGCNGTVSAVVSADQFTYVTTTPSPTPTAPPSPAATTAGS